MTSLLTTGSLKGQQSEDFGLAKTDKLADEIAIACFESSLTNEVFYRQLLRLIYRLLFLMVAEGRELLLIGDDVEKARIYREYYSVERLRGLGRKTKLSA